MPVPKVSILERVDCIPAPGVFYYILQSNAPINVNPVGGGGSAGRGGDLTNFKIF